MRRGYGYPHDKLRSKAKKSAPFNVKPKRKCRCGKGLGYAQEQCSKCQRAASAQPAARQASAGDHGVSQSVRAILDITAPLGGEHFSCGVAIPARLHVRQRLPKTEQSQ